MANEEIKKVITNNTDKNGNFKRKSNGRDVTFTKPTLPNTPPVKPTKSEK